MVGVRTVLCAVFVLFLFPVSPAQDPPSAALAAPDDTAKVMRLSDLCFAYRRAEGDSALLFGHMALELARKLGFRKGEAQACNDLAIIHIDRSRFTEADSLLRRALRLRTDLGDSAGMGAVHSKLGNVYQSWSRYDAAMAENLRALRIYERIGPPTNEAVVLHNIAILQYNMRRYADALATHLKAVELRRVIGDERGIAESEGNMANIHLHMGDTAAAVVLYERAITYFRTHGLARELATQLHNLGSVRLGQQFTGPAERLFTEALAIRRSAGEKKAIASTLIGIGATRMRERRFGEAERSLREALELSREVNARTEAMQAMLDLMRVFAMKNMGDSVLVYHDRYNAMKDSVFSADLATRTAEMEALYEVEKKAREIQRQRADLVANDLRIAKLGRESERRRFWLVLAIASSGLILAGGVILLQAQRRRARALSDAALFAERERGLKALMESTEAERRRIALELHDGVGQRIGGLRFRLEAAAARDEGLRELLPLVDDAGQEVRDLAHHMMPRALASHGLVTALDEVVSRSLSRPGMSARFDHAGLEGRLPGPIEVGVYRIAQELLSNVLRHAPCTEVSVQLLRNRTHLILMVEDNGPGFDPISVPTGLGLQGMNERARLMNGTLTFAPGPERGTIATLRVPLDTDPS